ncbi:MAG: acyl-CoA dehydrogenase family protein, partial [Acidimicrobiales bacterium]|nr:acyl-CoA dehydrogenase family protein [Acidimicrobiales bacterium]
MDFTAQETHEAVREGVRRVCSKFDDAYWRNCDANHEFPWAFYDALAEGGWVGLAIPEEYGGGGQGITEASILLEEIAASGAAMNGCSAVHLSIFGMNPVVKHGSDAMKAKYLPDVVDGSLHVAFGVTEPDAGTDTTSITTSAKRTDGGYLIRGRKVWTTKALLCQKVLLLARTTPLEECKKRTDGMTLFLADLQKPEVDIVAIPKIGRNAVVSCEVRYDDLFVAEEDRVGDEGSGFRYLLDGLNPERILVASEALGIGRAAIRKAVQYANDRVVFGRPIGKNQAVAFPLAQSHASLRAAELVIREASWRYDNGLPCAEHANTAKLLAAEAAF